jgi:hypothetical protein
MDLGNIQTKEGKAAVNSHLKLCPAKTKPNSFNPDSPETPGLMVWFEASNSPPCSSMPTRLAERQGMQHTPPGIQHP